MKTIGIIGGMSPESTIEYYRTITHEYLARFGDYAYPKILINSVSFQPFVDWPKQGRWDLVANGLIEAARALALAGAEFLIIATNTMHRVFDDVQSSIDLPILSIVDATADAVQASRLSTVGLMGTEFIMEGSLYPNVFERKGIKILVPQDSSDRKIINRTIYSELTAGIINPESCQKLGEIAAKMVRHGAQGIILGCTELPLILKTFDTGIPVFDTTQIHAIAALEYALR